MQSYTLSQMVSGNIITNNEHFHHLLRDNMRGSDKETFLQQMNISYRECNHYSVADPGFPRGGGANSRGGGANIRFCQNFPKTA